MDQRILHELSTNYVLAYELAANLAFEKASQMIQGMFLVW